jgi:hypothetical protein
MMLNTKDFIVKILPHKLRKVRLMKLLGVVMVSFNRLQNDFSAYKKEVLYKLSVNGQTIQIEWFLNDAFDSIQRRIQILHKKSTNKYLYNKEEGQIRLYVYNKGETHSPVFLRTKGENTGSGLTTNFLVQAPSELQLENGKLKANIDRHKLAGKNYIIDYK